MNQQQILKYQEISLVNLVCLTFIKMLAYYIENLWIISIKKELKELIESVKSSALSLYKEIEED